MFMITMSTSGRSTGHADLQNRGRPQFCKPAPLSCNRTTTTGSVMQASIACEHTRANYRFRLTTRLRMCGWIDKTPFATCSPSNGSTKTRSPRTAVGNHQRMKFRIAVGGERVFVEPFDGEQVANGVLPSKLHFHDYDVNNWAKQRSCRLAKQRPASVVQASTPFCKPAPRSWNRTTQTG